MLWTQLSIFFKQMLMKNEQCTVTNVTFYNGGGGHRNDTVKVPGHYTECAWSATLIGF